MLEYDVDAAVVREAADFFGDGHDAVVNHFICANLLGFFESFIIAGRGDYVRAEELRNLNRGAADAAARGENEHAFAGLQLRAVDEHVPSRLEDQRDSGGLRPIQIFGIRKAVDFRATDEFRESSVDHVAKIGVVAAQVVVAGQASGTFAAGDPGSENDFLADMDRVYLGADFGDFAGDIAARDMRERNRDARQTSADPEVEMIQRAGVDAHKDVVGAQVGFVDVGVVEDGRVAVLVEEDGFHMSLRSYMYRITI